MSMWDYDEKGDPYPPNDSSQYHHPYASHSESSGYHGDYGGQQSHSNHDHHNHGNDGHHAHHGHSHSEHDDGYSYYGQRSRGSPSQQNYGSHHDLYAPHGNHQGHGHDHGHESYISPTYSSNNIQSSTTQATHYGGGHQSYDMSVGYEIQHDHQPLLLPPSIGNGHEALSGDLFVSDSVVNLTLDEIDALARTHRSRSWLVVLYAPWCRFCQAMEPNFKTVADHLERSHVYVGRFQADGNHKEYAKSYLQLEHFPTILFFPKNSSNIVKYQSENREVDALLGFVHAFE